MSGLFWPLSINGLIMLLLEKRHLDSQAILAASGLINTDRLAYFSGIDINPLTPEDLLDKCHLDL